MSATTTPRRRLAVALLVLLVLALHGLVALWLPDVRLGEGNTKRMPKRMQVAYVRELQQQAPPAAAPVVVPRPNRVRAKHPPKPAAAASAPAVPPTSVAKVEPNALASADALPELPPPPAAPTAAQLAANAAQAAASAAASASAVAAAAAASAPQAFEWPPSTRLTYKLSGYYRGDVLGAATVEWVRDGQRYQVNLDVYVGAQSAPVVGRRMTSEGLLTEHGLQPQRYDEETRALLHQVRHRSIRFEDDRVLLPKGKVGELLPGIQDAASQFVQFTWLFTTHPELLQVGRTIDMPLALPTKVDHWYYDVVGEETLQTPAGPVRAYHMKPRRAPKPGGDLVVDVWFAPTLQYLPVRLLVRQDETTYGDLLLDRLPQQAAPQR